MLFRISAYLPAAAMAAGALMLGAAGGALAHEQRAVGKYAFEVGFAEEPALVNQLNGVFLNVRFFEDGIPEAGEGEEVEGGEAVVGLDESLTVELIVGGGAAKKEISFEPIEGEAGSYVAAFLPTVTGDYTFHIFGEIEGTEIDESFESGPGRFDSVESLDAVAFPAAPANDAALSATVKALESKVDGLDSGGSDGTARNLGAAGLVAGLVALALGGYAVIRQRG